MQHQRSKRKPVPTPQTKAVLRKLPPFMEKVHFEKALTNYMDNIDYYYFIPGSIEFGHSLIFPDLLSPC